MIMKHFIRVLILSFFVLCAYAQENELENRLFLLPDVIFQPMEAPPGFQAAYELKIRQPVDHSDPQKGFFYQKVYLSHKDFDRPMIFVTEGYNCQRNSVYELTRMLNANQVIVEHRYFGESCPDSIDYDYLNLKQETADLHHINDLLRNLYPGKWISTGISKGGQTTLYYRYFYPSDVDVSVPYVAPLNLEAEDNRIYTFLDTIGTEECHARIRALQTRLLKSRDAVLPLLRFYCAGAKLSFTYLTFEEAFEYTVLEYPFSFWQWGFNCDLIPSDTASLESALFHLLDVSDISFFSDREISAFAPHYYQAAAEMGYYGYRTEEFDGLIRALPLKSHPSAALTPGKMKVHFNNELATAAYHWLQTKGDKIIYIYGGIDTWSATAVPPSKKVDALWFFLPGQGHAGARIRNMTPEEKERLVSALERWLNMDIPGETENNP
jgi:PS-10 peptidase S37